MKKLLAIIAIVGLIATSAVISNVSGSEGGGIPLNNLCSHLIGTLQGCLGSVGAKVVVPVQIVMNEKSAPAIFLDISHDNVDRGKCESCVDSYNNERVSTGCLSLPVVVLI